MMLQTIVEPIVLGFESDQYSGRLSMTGDDYLLGFSQAQESRQIVLDFSQRRSAHRAFCDWRATARLLTS